MMREQGGVGWGGEGRGGEGRERKGREGKGRERPVRKREWNQRKIFRKTVDAVQASHFYKKCIIVILCGRECLDDWK